jgi:tetratricopeptide (TPR) repeat protein
MRGHTVITNSWLAALLLVAACGCRDATDYANRAVEQEKSGDLRDALANFDRAIKLKPDFVDAFIGRGDVKYKIADFSGAMGDYTNAARLKPELLHPHFIAQFATANPTNPIANKAVVLLGAKDYDKLDALAAKLRTSKERYADGTWQLANFYSGLIPLTSDPDTAWDDRVMAIAMWSTARPESITARVAWADVLVCYAWKARGGGEVNTVSPEGWRLFFQRLRQAMVILKAATSVNEKCPVYWSVMMRAALGLQANQLQFDDIFDEATKSEPGYEAYYFSRAVYLLPRWYGRGGEWGSDLAAAADKVGGENGDMLYAQVVWNLNRDYFVNPFLEGNASWKRVDNGFQIIEKHFPDALEARIERAYLAALFQSGLAQDYYRRGQADYGNHDLFDALTNFDKAVEYASNYFGAYYMRGRVEKDIGDLPGALADYNKTIELKPDYASAYDLRADVKKTLGDTNGALADYNLAIGLNPTDGYAYYYRSIVRGAKGDSAGAQSDFIMSLKLNSNLSTNSSQ